MATSVNEGILRYCLMSKTHAVVFWAMYCVVWYMTASIIEERAGEFHEDRSFTRHYGVIT
jgi:hypothetical protein